MLRELVDNFAGLNVLVVGDIIFDRYTTVTVQGLTSKDGILSGRVLGEETQAGGALVVCRHLLEFTPNVRLIGLTGGDAWSDDLIRDVIPETADEILRHSEFTTIVKQRFVEPPREGNQLSKLFAVNQINGNFPSEAVQREVADRVESLIASADLVMVMDFGHGVMGESIRRLVEEKAKFMALNCQTNSNNHGFNIINRQYRRCDSFSLDQAEIQLACGKRICEFGEELAKLKTDFSAKYAWLTRGGVETIGMRDGEANCVLPPFEGRVVDTIGAGDAFTSVASLAAASGLPINICTFLGQLAGAQAVRVIGNSEPIRKHRLLKGCEAMLTI
jgi:bifunctional ADP-heptose synthase (sugar kinase/adenylyltransferase)